ncbi:hypothetical protein GWI33_001754 [Rhynchophorus ferrugineus]|uniref:Uncharacterized protein n=1 Tax=Rhynchophorus ferrugineus TaxID=354439 RepID=A0A834MLN7_RHYFE|nr:hypothetical protein GWI33_001754 [Rhynchophorus ferrugineus]
MSPETSLCRSGEAPFSQLNVAGHDITINKQKYRRFENIHRGKEVPASSRLSRETFIWNGRRAGRAVARKKCPSSIPNSVQLCRVYEPTDPLKVRRLFSDR